MHDIPWTNIALFSEIPEGQLKPLQSIFHRVRKEAGENIITEGETGDEMYILVEGRVRISKAMLVQGMKLPLTELQDTRKVLATLDHNLYPIFGEMALLDEDTRSATVEVLDPSEFLATSRERFFTLVADHPDLGSLLLTALGKRLAATVRKNNSELVKLTTALALALGRAK